MNTYILLLVLLGVVLFIVSKLRKSQEVKGDAGEVKICETTGGICCGGSADCHKHKQAPKPTYYEDEELDRFQGRGADDYSSEEVAEWSEVVETLRVEEVEGWLSSIHMRGLHVPRALQARISERISQAS